MNHSADYFRTRRRALGVPERSDHFPSSALICRQAKELLALDEDASQ